MLLLSLPREIARPGKTTKVTNKTIAEGTAHSP